MTSIDEIVTELSGLLEKATPGPWELRWYERVTVPSDTDGSKSIAHVYRMKDTDAGDVNRKFIVAARNHLPALLARSRRMEEALRHMLGAIDGNTIDSEEIAGDYDSGIPPHKWHEQWAYYARAALEDT